MPSNPYKKRNLPRQREISKVQTDFFNASNTSTIPKKIQDSTYPTNFLSQSSHNSGITSLIEQQRLSDCLKCLEDAGYVGEAALFVLANLQVFGGAA